MGLKPHVLATLAIAVVGLAAETATAQSVPCAQKSVDPSAIRTRQDMVAFVNCASEYLQENGTAEAARAFRQHERWRSGQFYVFVIELDPDDGFPSIVHPAQPEMEGRPSEPLIDAFGSDLLTEFHRVLGLSDRGWIYYSFTNPATASPEPSEKLGHGPQSRSGVRVPGVTQGISTFG